MLVSERVALFKQHQKGEIAKPDRMMELRRTIFYQAMENPETVVSTPLKILVKMGIFPK